MLQITYIRCSLSVHLVILYVDSYELSNTYLKTLYNNKLNNKLLIQICMKILFC